MATVAPQPSENVLEGGNPILDALPPKSDYMTYLTILEYQLTPDRLPSLQKALEEDSENALTENIGWDLVQLLLPMLPQSEKCLDLVARKGNPKEVIIRVTEALEGIAIGLSHENVDTEQGVEYDAEAEAMKTFDGEAERIHLGEMKLDGMPDTTDDPRSREVGNTQHDREKLHSPKSHSASLPPIQFSTLLTMLAILHPRIKTKNPSRFLATSLQAVLRAYRNLIIPSITAKVVELLTKLSGRQRPALPPRTSTAGINQSSALNSTKFVTAPLPDPEDEQSGSKGGAPGDNDKAIVKRLLQAVALEVLEDFVLDAGSAQEYGMGWTTRLREQLEPRKIVPGKKTDTERFRSERELRDSDLIVEKLVRLCSVLDLNHPSTFTQILSNASSFFIIDDASDDEATTPTDYPTSPSDIPFSNKGILFYLSALCFDSILSYYKDIPPPSVSPQIFPDLAALLNKYLEPSPIGPKTLAQCPVSVLDSIFSLLYLALQKGRAGDYPATMDNFKSDIWQPILYLSAQHPIPEIRFSAYQISTELLHNHPSGSSRLTLIKETLASQATGDQILQQMVLEPLRSVAVGWVKSEVRRDMENRLTEDNRLMFFENEAADELSMLLFPEPLPPDGPPGLADLEITRFVSQLGFYTATLNFGYYLLSLDLNSTQATLRPAIDKMNEAYSKRRRQSLKTSVARVREKGLTEEDPGLGMELSMCEYALEQFESRL